MFQVFIFDGSFHKLNVWNLVFDLSIREAEFLPQTFKKTHFANLVSDISVVHCFSSYFSNLFNFFLDLNFNLWCFSAELEILFIAKNQDWRLILQHAIIVNNIVEYFGSFTKFAFIFAIHNQDDSSRWLNHFVNFWSKVEVSWNINGPNFQWIALWNVNHWSIFTISCRVFFDTTDGISDLFCV